MTSPSAPARIAALTGLLVAAVFTSCGGGRSPSSTPSHGAALPPASAPGWPFPRGEGSPTSARGMVATDAALATQVGSAMLASGGNAVDAAVATAFALAVVFPTAGNVGGGGFLVARVDGASYALDFRETAPAAATRGMYLGADGKPMLDSREGWRSVGVPGSVAGLYEAWRKLGSKRRTWADLLAPGVALADQGFVVDEAFAHTVALVQTRLAKYPGSAALFLPGGAPPAVGTRFRNPDLAGVLRRVAQEGPAGFYAGPVAASLARAMRDGGGLVTAVDLASYQAKWRTPLEFTYRGRTIVGMPPPSSGGAALAMIAHVLAAWDLRALGWNSAAHVHLVAEAMRRAFAARNARLGDPDFIQNPLPDLLSESWAAAQRATIRMDRATPTRDLFSASAGPAPEGPHTTHLSVVDGSGNAVALTTTLNDWYGSGVTVAGLGVVLNDEMDDFAVVPGEANLFGLVQGEANAVAPGKRMLSSMAPTLVLGADRKIEFVLGAAGGSRIITAVFEELSDGVDFGMNIADAVRAPRFHQQDSPDLLFVEPHGMGADVRRALEAMGHTLQEADHLADAPGVGRLGVGGVGGLWQGAADPRRAGGLAVGP